MGKLGDRKRGGNKNCDKIRERTKLCTYFVLFAFKSNYKFAKNDRSKTQCCTPPWLSSDSKQLITDLWKSWSSPNYGLH